MRLYTDEQVEGFLADGWWSGATWMDLLDGHVRDRPDQVSIVDPANRSAVFDGEPRRLTWREVGDEVRALARSLFRAGVRRDDVVGVQLPNSTELAVAYLAIARLGAITCPFPVQYARHELTTMGRLAGMRTFVTTARVNRLRLADQAATLGLDAVLAWGSDLPTGVVDLGRDLADDTDDAAFDAYVAALTPHPNDCVTLCWTSGTEGTPKGVPRAHGDWQAIASGTISTPRLTADDVLLNLFPMVNAGGLAGMYLPWLMLGARLVQHHPFDLDVFVRQLEDEHVTYTCAPPSVLDTLVTSPDALAGVDLSSLRAVGSGSAPLAARMIEAWERDRGVEVLNLFGSNEGLCLFGCPDTVPDPADRGRLFPRPGDPSFAWRARIGRESLSRLVDLETGADVTVPGRQGELRVSSPAIFAGYWGDVPPPFDERGWYRTGDIFEITDDDGHLLRYVDRAKDLIGRGGYKISAVEIESLLLADTRIAEVALVGVPDERLGERVCAVVAPRDPADPPSLPDLLELLAGLGVARFKWPEFLEIVDALPRNPVGKVLKRVLRDRVAAGHDAAAAPVTTAGAVAP